MDPWIGDAYIFDLPFQWMKSRMYIFFLSNTEPCVSKSRSPSHGCLNFSMQSAITDRTLREEVSFLHGL